MPWPAKIIDYRDVVRCGWYKYGWSIWVSSDCTYSCWTYASSHCTPILPLLWYTGNHQIIFWMHDYTHKHTHTHTHTHIHVKVMIWNRCQYHWLLSSRGNRWLWFPRQKACNVELWCFRYYKHNFDQKVSFPVIRDAMIIIQRNTFGCYNAFHCYQLLLLNIY